MKCLICNKEFHVKGFPEHLKKHKIVPREYYDTYLKQEDDGKCIQCGNETDFISVNLGYKKHCCKECAAKTGSQNAQENMGLTHLLNLKKLKIRLRKRI